MPPTDEILTDLRLAVARLETKVEGIDEKLDTTVVSHLHLETRLAPLTANINRWKGGMAVLVLVGGIVGSLLVNLAKSLFGFTSQ